MKRYKAVKRGYDNQKIREVGEIFDFNGAPADWMVEVDDDGNVVGDDKEQGGEVKRRPGRPPKAD